MITHVVEIAPADTVGNDDGHGRRVPVLHACPACGVRRRELLPSGRWTLSHDHDGTWTVRRSGRLLVAC